MNALLKEKNGNKRQSFNTVDETGRVWRSFLRVQVVQENSDFHVELAGEMIADDFVPDHHRTNWTRVQIPQIVRKPARSK